MLKNAEHRNNGASNAHLWTISTAKLSKTSDWLMEKDEESQKEIGEVSDHAKIQKFIGTLRKEKTEKNKKENLCTTIALSEISVDSSKVDLNLPGLKTLELSIKLDVRCQVLLTSYSIFNNVSYHDVIIVCSLHLYQLNLGVHIGMSPFP